jgi:inward rectifier potassium channel
MVRYSYLKTTSAMLDSIGMSRRTQHLRIFDLYHSLLSVSWSEFLVLIVSAYLTVNGVFATAYFLCGPESLEGVRGSVSHLHFLDCFFFSVQTLATIGYGRIGPSSLVANILVTIEALIGLMSLAVVTGLVFARFARPTARVLFSQNALFVTRNGEKVLMLRLGNERRNQIVEASVNVFAIIGSKTTEGEFYYNINDLKLLRSHSPVFELTWTLLHPLDESSPFYNFTPEDFVSKEVEIVVSLTGLDETFLQTITARRSYMPEDLRWGHKFADILEHDKDGEVLVRIDRLSELQEG